MIETPVLLKKILFLSEFIAFAVALWKFKKFKSTYWKWFIYYLVFIFVVETISKFILCYYVNFRSYFYDFFVIPIEFLFLFWLYGYKSLGNKRLFWVCSITYLLSLLPYFIFKENKPINSFNYIVGTFLTSLMVILEFHKQIKSDDILKFRENMMFYINTGVCLFYIANLPFFSFNALLWNHKIIYYNYYFFFLITGAVMYLLFSIALLWGKPNTY